MEARIGSPTIVRLRAIKSADQMLLAAVLLVIVPSLPDTVELDAARALQQAVEHSRILEAARQREVVAAREVDQARAWVNPQLGLAAENVGAVERFAGIRGVEGLEGQAVVTAPLPLGGDRRAAISRSHAVWSAADAAARVVDADVRLEVLFAIAAAERDRALVAHATEERVELDRFAGMLALGVERGRFPAGHAARAELAAGLAATEEARRRVAAAATEAEIARLVGLPPGTPLRIPAPACAAPGSRGLSDQLLPEEQLADARVHAASARIAVSRARAVPDLHPQLGIRRTAGVTGLYLGFALELPTFDRGGAAIAAARAEHLAVTAERDELAGRLAAERVAVREALRTLEEVGSRFSPGWLDALDRSVAAGRTAYELGEGSLTDVIDGRRARLASLDDHARWQAELRDARARSARLGGGELDASLLCIAGTNPTSR
jgi:outer membrane protein TolC